MKVLLRTLDVRQLLRKDSGEEEGIRNVEQLTHCKQSGGQRPLHVGFVSRPQSRSLPAMYPPGQWLECFRLSARSFGRKVRPIQRPGRPIYPAMPRLPSSWEGLVVDNTHALRNAWMRSLAEVGTS
jgi:hypothetical protein